MYVVSTQSRIVCKRAFPLAKDYYIWTSRQIFGCSISWFGTVNILQHRGLQNIFTNSIGQEESLQLMKTTTKCSSETQQSIRFNSKKITQAAL